MRVQIEVSDTTYERLCNIAASWQMSVPQYVAWLCDSLPLASTLEKTGGKPQPPEEKE